MSRRNSSRRVPETDSRRDPERRPRVRLTGPKWLRPGDSPLDDVRKGVDRGQELISKSAGTAGLSSNSGCMTVSCGSRRRRVGRLKPFRWRVSDAMWEQLAPLLPDPPRRFRSPGRPRYSARLCLEGVLYVLFTGTPWLEVPYRELGLPSGETCRRRLEEWARKGLLEDALVVLQHQLADAGRLDWDRVIIDASLADVKKGARRSRAPSVARRAAVSISQ